MVGRVAEQKKLAKAMSSNESEFVAVYGRRRIGKTYLVREFFKGKFLFQHTGIEKGNFKRQLSGFRDSLVDCGYKGCPMPDDWTVAFRLLKELIERSRQTRKVIFIDEMLGWIRRVPNSSPLLNISGMPGCPPERTLCLWSAGRRRRGSSTR